MWMTTFSTLIETAGWASTAVCIWAFQSKTMIPLRIAAILANVLSIVFSYYHASWPNLVLNAVLLPLNTVRLLEMRKLIADVRKAATSDLRLDWLKPFMKKVSFKAGTRLFAKGDRADAAYVVVRGTVRLPDVGVTFGPGDLLGEMGLFTTGGERTAAAVCDSDVEALVLTYERFEQLYFQNPEFGLYLVRLIVQRLQGGSPATPRRQAAAEGPTPALHPATLISPALGQVPDPR